MKRLIATLLFLLAPVLAEASSSTPHISVGTFASMPTCDSRHDRWVYFVEDASATGDCTAGGGTETYAICTCSAAFATWEPSGDGGGGGSGTVTSVAASGPSSFFTWSGSPVTTSGTLTASLSTQSANTVLAGPTSGGAATPAFRSLVAADLPSLTYFGPEGVKYDPDRLDATYWAKERFYNGSYDLTWTQENWGSTTATLDSTTDRLYITPPTGTGDHVRALATALPTGTDWVATAKSGGMDLHYSYNLCGIAVTIGGTSASPTTIEAILVFASTFDAHMEPRSITGGYNSGSGTVYTDRSIGDVLVQTRESYWQFRYVTSTKVLSFWWSLDGIQYYQTNTPVTEASDPLYFELIANTNHASELPTCSWDWVVIKNSTDATTGY